jgi:BirA family biotin operon repressor/biotin-[acetyl-CoA-carboxylase] ligase
MVNLDMSKYSIVTIEEVHSTNSYALEYLSSFEDRTVLFASHQTSGRGRYDRKWITDGTENVYMSFVLKPVEKNNYPFPNLTQYLSVCVCRVLEKNFDIQSNIKWPNDILVNGAKISGILAETGMEKNQITAVVLGLGLNVNLKQETINSIDQKATSISVLKNRNYNPDEIVRMICDEFFANYEQFVSGGFEYIKDEYIKRCAFLGQNISIREAEERKKYFAKSIDNDGLLVAIDENKKECRIITGDVLCY